MKRQIPNINIVRSAWRRVKKDIKEAIIRDLKPVKDVKGGRRVAGESKPTTGETGAPQAATNQDKVAAFHSEIVIQIRTLPILFSDVLLLGRFC